MDDTNIKAAIWHSRLKVEWAKNHINGVIELVNTLTSDQTAVVKPYQDPQSGTYHLYIGPRSGLPVNLPLHIGDAVHNLNSVVDFLWSGLARTVNQALFSKVTFPRNETLQGLSDRLSTGIDAAIKQNFPEIDDFILNQVKPYKGTCTLVWPLNKLDNINKHRLLITTTNIISFKRWLLSVAEDGGTFRQAAGFAFRHLARLLLSDSVHLLR